MTLSEYYRNIQWKWCFESKKLELRVQVLSCTIYILNASMYKFLLCYFIVLFHRHIQKCCTDVHACILCLHVCIICMIIKQMFFFWVAFQIISMVMMKHKIEKSTHNNLPQFSSGNTIWKHVFFCSKYKRNKLVFAIYKINRKMYSWCKRISSTLKAN